MDSTNAKNLILETIEQITTETQEYVNLVDKYSNKVNENNIKLHVLKDLLKQIDTQDLNEELKKNLKNSDASFKMPKRRVKSNSTLQPVSTDVKDKKKIELFEEFIIKCGDERNITIIKKLMPKIEYYTYNKKGKIWNKPEAFFKDLEDYKNRTKHWANHILLQEKTEIQEE